MSVKWGALILAVMVAPVVAAIGHARLGAASTLLQVAPGEPLPGLDAPQLEAFQKGKALFSRVFFEDQGLGPRFNETACNACHTDPADGGIGDQFQC